ncbi:hypothetical protein D3C85_1607160 [compost metagenome]
MLITVFLNRQHLAVGELKITVATYARRQYFGRFALYRLTIQLLVSLVDENDPIVRQTKRTTAIFVHPATHAEPWRRQTFRHAVTPMPDPARSVCGAILVPEQALWADLHFGKIDAGGDSFGSADRLSFWR